MIVLNSERLKACVRNNKIPPQSTINYDTTSCITDTVYNWVFVVHMSLFWYYCACLIYRNHLPQPNTGRPPREYRGALVFRERHPPPLVNHDPDARLGGEVGHVLALVDEQLEVETWWQNQIFFILANHDCLLSDFRQTNKTHFNLPLNTIWKNNNLY